MDCKNANFTLRSGKKMPFIGLGTYKIDDKQMVRQVLDLALKTGYRLIDTAAMYCNEVEIGIAIKELLPKYNLKREDIFITSKLLPDDQGKQALEALKTSLKNLDCGYLDLYLIHWPGDYGLRASDPRNKTQRSISWSCLVEGVNQGLVKDIGVSNYTIRHLKELLNEDYGIRPAVNQVEWHPYHFQPDLKQFCEKEEILLQAYSSLGGSGNTELLNDPVIREISEKLEKTSSQVLLRWAFQQNVAIIPKARTQRHLEENMALNFEIPEEFITKLNNLDRKEKFDWDPENVA